MIAFLIEKYNHVVQGSGSTTVSLQTAEVSWIINEPCMKEMKEKTHISMGLSMRN